MIKCVNCRFWAGHMEHWLPQSAVCERITSGGGRRNSDARIFPATSGAWLETEREFGCTWAESLLHKED